jgi:putative hydrolase of the HAD superfamily
MIRALIFDLDDTLYPERQFVRSGFHAVATEVTRRFGVPRRGALATLFCALRQGNRGQALQELCRQHDLPATIVSELVETIRAHVPTLRLPPSTAAALAAARARGWRLGVLTNGLPAVQARKAEALGLGALVDTVVYAHDCGTRAGKPAPEPFQIALAQLETVPAACVFVGDDPWCDIAGARHVGLRTILLCRQEHHGPLTPGCEPDVVVRGMDEVIAAVEQLWRGEMAHAD